MSATGESALEELIKNPTDQALNFTAFDVVMEQRGANDEQKLYKLFDFLELSEETRSPYTMQIMDKIVEVFNSGKLLEQTVDIFARKIKGFNFAVPTLEEKRQKIVALFDQRKIQLNTKPFI